MKETFYISLIPCVIGALRILYLKKKAIEAIKSDIFYTKENHTFNHLLLFLHWLGAIGMLVMPAFVYLTD
jgi:hypothetical protein